MQERFRLCNNPVPSGNRYCHGKGREHIKCKLECEEEDVLRGGLTTRLRYTDEGSSDGSSGSGSGGMCLIPTNNSQT